MQESEEEAGFGCIGNVDGKESMDGSYSGWSGEPALAPVPQWSRRSSGDRSSTVGNASGSLLGGVQVGDKGHPIKVIMRLRKGTTMEMMLLNGVVTQRRVVCCPS